MGYRRDGEKAILDVGGPGNKVLLLGSRSGDLLCSRIHFCQRGGVGILSIIYLARTFRPRTKGVGERTKGKSRMPIRLLLASGLLALSAVAFGVGGTYSPVLLFLAGLTVFFWHRIPLASVFVKVVPIEGSIMLRSKYAPFL